MDKAKTRDHYERLPPDELCPCEYCRNYIRHIRGTFPLVAEYLDSLGVDIEKPFEAIPLEPDDDGMIQYIGEQYIVLGSRDGFEPTEISGISIDIAESHPATQLSCEHFVIELSPLRLRWGA